MQAILSFSYFGEKEQSVVESLYWYLYLYHNGFTYICFGSAYTPKTGGLYCYYYLLLCIMFIWFKYIQH